LIEAAALAGAPQGTRLEVVMEPTGPAWLPIAVFFSARGHAVFRVSSQKAADLRRFLSRHAKSNGIDADTLARLPLLDPHGLAPLRLPGSERAALDRRVRACDRLSMQGAEHKVRLKDLVRQLMPLSPLTGDLGQADLAVLERWADPRALLRLGQTQLSAVIAKASRNHLGSARGRGVVGHRAGRGAALRRAPGGRVRRPRRRGRHRGTADPGDRGGTGDPRRRTGTAYRWADPGQLARTLPGLGEVGGPVLAAVIGEATRSRPARPAHHRQVAQLVCRQLHPDPGRLRHGRRTVQHGRDSSGRHAGPAGFGPGRRAAPLADPYPRNTYSRPWQSHAFG
jgi:transposase